MSDLLIFICVVVLVLINVPIAVVVLLALPSRSRLERQVETMLAAQQKVLAELKKIAMAVTTIIST